MVLSAFSIWALPLLFSLLFGPTLGLRVPVPEVKDTANKGLAMRGPIPRMLDLAQKEEHKLDRRITCYEDDYLLSLQNFIDDAYPSCSSFIGIEAVTSTTALTSGTYVSPFSFA